MRLRAVEISDLPLLYRWENDASAWADSDTHNPLSHNLLREYIESTTGDLYKDGQLRLVIEDESCNEPHIVGCADLFDLDARSGKAAIGLYISPEERCKGYSRLAMQKLMPYAFDFLGLKQIYAIIMTDNAPCLALFRSLGFEESAVLKKWVRTAKDKYVDVVVLQCFA